MAKDLGSKKVTGAFAKRLRAVRQSGGYTQDQFSLLLGIRRDRYAKYELGLAEPPFIILVRICELANTSLDFLISGKKPTSPASMEFLGSGLSEYQDLHWKEGARWWKTNENHQLIEFWYLHDKMKINDPYTMNKTRWESRDVDLTKDEHWARHKADLDARRPIKDFSFEKINQNGERWIITISGNPVFDEEGSFKGYCGIAYNEPVDPTVSKQKTKIAG